MVIGFHLRLRYNTPIIRASYLMNRKFLEKYSTVSCLINAYPLAPANHNSSLCYEHSIIVEMPSRNSADACMWQDAYHQNLIACNIEASGVLGNQLLMMYI